MRRMPIVALLLTGSLTPVAALTAEGPAPSFDCGKVEAGSIEAMVCDDAGLAALDRRLAGVYREASERALNEHPPVLKAEQRGWIKGRNGCWKSDDVRGCVAEAYRLRTAELQARYRLVDFNGPGFYACDGDPRNEGIATYFETDPPTLIAERGDSVSLMYLRPAASGSKYKGPNEMLWIKGSEALVTWGYGAPEMRCTQASAQD